MNSEAQIKNFLLTLSESFPGAVKTSTLQVYYTQIADDLANADLPELTKKLTRACGFFPTIKDILDALGSRQSPRELAQSFVETMIAILQGSKNAWEAAGPDNYRLWKKHIGLTRFDFVSVDPKFHKGAWIDKMEKVFAGETEKPLLNMAELIQLRGNVEDGPA